MAQDTDVTPRPWGENVRPTAQQVSDWLAACTEAERVAFAERMAVASDEAAQCFIQNHVSTIRHLESSWQAGYDAGFAEALAKVTAGLEAGLPDAIMGDAGVSR